MNVARNYRRILDNALARHHAGQDPATIELPEQSVFPHLINAQPATARISRMTGVLLGKSAPHYVKRGRLVFYRLSDILAWLGDDDAVASTAAANISATVAKEDGV